MKKLMVYLFALIFALAFAMSCSNNELEEKESVAIDGLPETIDLPSVPTGDITFTVTSNVNWSVSLQNLDWVSVSPSRGLGNGESVVVTISPQVNKDFEPRSGKLTVTAGTVTASATLNQQAAVADPVFNVEGFEGDTFYLDALEVEGKSFNVSSNKDWTAEVSNMAWATVSPLSGGKDRSATITVVPKTANDEEVREGTISFNYGAAAPKVVKVVHKKFEPQLTLSVAELTASSTGKLANPTVKVTSNAAWTATSSQPWAKVDKTSGEAGETEVTLSLEANVEGKDRSAVVAFKNKGLTVELTVNQGSEFVETSVATISTAENTAAFEVRANVAWTITSSESWATVTPSEGTGNATVTVTMNPHTPGAGSRKANITVAAKEVEGLAAIVELEQLEPVLIQYVDLTQTPVLFCSNNQAWNIQHSPGYATSGKTGSEAQGGTGEGTGHLVSYSHTDNKDLYMQFETVNSYGPVYIMAAEGNICAGNIWTGDAYVFHIPVTRILSGQTLNFDYGLYGAGDVPIYYNSEVSFDEGKTWHSFDTGSKSVSPNGGDEANSVSLTASKKEIHFTAKYVLTETVENVEMLVRVRCTDGSYVRSKKTVSAPKTSGVMRIIGADHNVTGDANTSDAKGPKFYVTTGEDVIIPELSVSQKTISVTETTASFKVTSNVAWTVTSSEAWAIVSPAEGTGEGNVNITLTALEPGSPDRTATITVAAKDYAGVTETVTIEQIAPAPAGPEGNYVDLATSKVLFCSNNQAWNMENNPDYASEGNTGAVSGKGTGKVLSYSHYANPDVYMQYYDAELEFQTPIFIMAKEGNITAKQMWTDDAFEFHVPVWKAKTGQTLYFDFQIYVKGKSSPKYWAVEYSLDGGKTYAMFNTGVSETAPTNQAAANFVIPKNESMTPMSAQYTFAEDLNNFDLRVRFRCVDAVRGVSGSDYSSPGAGAVRIFGKDQNSLAGDASVVSGPEIYIK